VSKTTKRERGDKARRRCNNNNNNKNSHVGKRLQHKSKQRKKNNNPGATIKGGTRIRETSFDKSNASTI